MSTIIDSGTVNNFNTNNSILGTNQAETLLGGKGNDTLEGLSNDDELYGDEGNDILIGGQGNDILIGGQGSDTLIGGQGNDTLIGGQGNDVFQFTKADLDSLDMIEDFAEGLDKIEITGLSSADRITYDAEGGYIALNDEKVIEINTNLELNIDYIEVDAWEFM